jgi:hypothetical protein
VEWHRTASSLSLSLPRSGLRLLSAHISLPRGPRQALVSGGATALHFPLSLADPAGSNLRCLKNRGKGQYLKPVISQPNVRIGSVDSREAPSKDCQAPADGPTPFPQRGRELSRHRHLPVLSPL